MVETPMVSPLKLIRTFKTNHMKIFKYIKEKIDLKEIKRKRLEIFDRFTFGKITYDEYTVERKKLEEEIKTIQR